MSHEKVDFVSEFIFRIAGGGLDGPYLHTHRHTGGRQRATLGVHDRPVADGLHAAAGNWQVDCSFPFTTSNTPVSTNAWLLVCHARPS